MLHVPFTREARVFAEAEGVDVDRLVSPGKPYSTTPFQEACRAARDDEGYFGEEACDHALPVGDELDFIEDKPLQRVFDEACRVKQEGIVLCGKVEEAWIVKGDARIVWPAEHGEG